MAGVQVTDVIVPSIFTPYMQQITAEKSRLIQSGVLVRNPVIDGFLAGGGKTFDIPSFLDLDASDSTGADNVATDSLADIQTMTAGGTMTNPRGDASPLKILTAREVGVRLVRNQSWSSTNLAGELAGADPMAAIATRVANYWLRRQQKTFVATWSGVLADNEAAPSGSEHVQYDLINDVSGLSFVDGVTNFTAEAFLDACLTMGDSMDELAVVMVHSVVFSRMQKNNLIDFIPDATGQIMIPTFLGREVIVDDGMPRTGSVYDSWLFGRGAGQYGEAAHDVPTEITREALAGNGNGQEILTTRKVICMHPTGHAFIQSGIPDGGPTNANIATAANWVRRYPERKQIRFAVLRTREA